VSTMDRTRIKICGIKDPDTAVAALDAGADAIGLVFVENSPRHVTVDEAKAITRALPDDAVSVGLFVDTPGETMKQIVDEVGLAVAQLHGHESIDDLDPLYGVPAWKALPFDEDFMRVGGSWDHDPRVEALLVDTPPTGELTGGSGIAFDWTGLAEVMPRFAKPIILAGGLTPDNVADAIRTVEPYAVDVSSGVESSRGVKEIGLIKAFCEAVRQADSR
ncbi:MAG: phosphoribosylanthranilate isomerase, partial [Phycisphaeraceae bacterium]